MTRSAMSKIAPNFGVFVIFCFFTETMCSNIQPQAVTLTEDNWTEILEGEWMVEFMAPWCPACRSFKETWNTFSKWSRDLDIQVGVIDVTENPGLSGRFLVTALPSIYHVKNGVFRQYVSGRAEKELIAFVDDKKWKDVEPVSKWTAPDSIQMSFVSMFFKIAMKIRAFYNLMTEQYGIPEWGCYVIFAIMTILLGLFIGLLLVCLCDFVNPAKTALPPPIPAHLMEPEHDKDGDIIDDTEIPDGDSVRQRKAKSERKEEEKTAEVKWQEQKKEGEEKKKDQ